ncbi:MAG: type II toxin-antitoxin system VapC family toxin [Dehalococcoidia bacterium]|nr:type II toxin-antitoxin system VapC family toxin [Dehalococcoidia bacterium]
MSPVLVDTNVLIDIFSDDPVWAGPSTDALRRLADSEILVVNPIIYAELSAAFDTIEALDEVLPDEMFRREHLPYEAAFLAGKVFLQYRRAGGSRRSPLPDCYIGAHAAVAGYWLLTRDSARHGHYFPSLRLMSP